MDDGGGSPAISWQKNSTSRKGELELVSGMQRSSCTDSSQYFAIPHPFAADKSAVDAIVSQRCDAGSQVY
jgi:hypothetical protein